ncbi:MAG TPA: hypothetical protein VME43_24270 [Bryobacteraceae bacterium]|nr:hypothetical protein [Bryobacteraceae bacterium]
MTIAFLMVLAVLGYVWFWFGRMRRERRIRRSLQVAVRGKLRAA